MLSVVSDFGVGTNIHNILSNILVYVFRILLNNDAHQISFNSADKLPRKWYQNMMYS